MRIHRHFDFNDFIVILFCKTISSSFYVRCVNDHSEIINFCLIITYEIWINNKRINSTIFATNFEFFICFIWLLIRFCSVISLIDRKIIVLSILFRIHWRSRLIFVNFKKIICFWWFFFSCKLFENIIYILIWFCIFVWSHRRKFELNDLIAKIFTNLIIWSNRSYRKFLLLKRYDEIFLQICCIVDSFIVCFETMIFTLTI